MLPYFSLTAFHNLCIEKAHLCLFFPLLYALMNYHLVSPVLCRSISNTDLQITFSASFVCSWNRITNKYKSYWKCVENLGAKNEN